MLDAAGPSLSDYLGALRRLWWIVVVVVGLALVIGALPTVLEDPTYASEVRVRDSYGAQRVPEPDDVVQEDESTENDQTDDAGAGDDGSSGDERGDDGSSGAGSSGAGARQEPVVELRELGSDLLTVITGRTRDAVIERLGPDAEPFGQVTASVIGVSTIIAVRVEAASPEGAAAAAQAYGEEFVDRRTAKVTEPLAAAVDELEARTRASDEQVAALEEQLSEPGLSASEREVLFARRESADETAREARRRADELALDAELRASGIEIIDDAQVNRNPVAPERRRAVGSSLVVGLLLGVGAAIVVDRLRRPSPDRDPDTSEPSDD